MYELAIRRVYVRDEVQLLCKLFRSVQAEEVCVVLENVPVSEAGNKYDRYECWVVGNYAAANCLWSE